MTEGQRSIDASIEVPGTPEEVWDTVATTDGMRSWFMAIDLDAPDTTVTAWDPPHRYVTESTAANGQPLAYEWIVEARDGGTCVVRLVNSGFGAGADWDAEYENMTAGWAMFFQNLRLHMHHFRGQRATLVEAASMVRQPVTAAWESLRAAVEHEAEFAGNVEWTGRENEVLLLEKPLPGTAVIVAVDCGELTMLAVSLYLYGDEGVAEAAGKELTAWMAARFPTAEAST